MNKATAPNLPLILADYTEFVKQQERRRQQVRDWYAKWEDTRSEVVTTGIWNISDRD